MFVSRQQLSYARQDEETGDYALLDDIYLIFAEKLTVA